MQKHVKHKMGIAVDKISAVILIVNPRNQPFSLRMESASNMDLK